MRKEFAILVMLPSRDVHCRFTTVRLDRSAATQPHSSGETMVKRKTVWTMAVAVSVGVTAPLFNYEEAPATPDADDPAIWVNRINPRRSLVIGTAKDAGLLVHDMEGRLVQALLPPNAPHVSPADPAQLVVARHVEDHRDEEAADRIEGPPGDQKPGARLRR
jgi:hypothetical protein